MLFLPDEMFKQQNKTIRVHIGRMIAPSVFDDRLNEKSGQKNCGVIFIRGNSRWSELLLLNHSLIHYIWLMVYRKVHILCLLLFLSNLIYGKGNDSILQNKNGYYSLKYYHNNIKGEMPFKKFQAIWLYSDNDRYKNCRPELKDDNWIPVTQT